MTQRVLRSRCTAGVLVGCLLLAGCLSSQNSAERRLERVTVQLQRQSDADSLAAAGLFLSPQDRAQALTLLARAADVAPARADLLWLRLQLCEREPACDPQPTEQRLRAVDPTNGAGWFGDLMRAVTAKDEAGTDAALTAMAHTEQVDIYWTVLVGHLSTAAARTGRLSLAEAMVNVTGFLAAMVIPVYGPALNSCKSDHAHRDDMQAVCRGVARAFENGDAGLTEMIGVAMAKHAWPEDSPEYRAAVERRRIYKYRSALQPVTWSAARSQRYVALCLEYPREQDVMREQVIAAGKDPNPPAGYSEP